MASGRSQQRRPFRIQNYPDIVSVCDQGRARVVTVTPPRAGNNMAVGEQANGSRSSDARSRSSGASATASAAAVPRTVKKTGQPLAHKAQTLPGVHRDSASVNMGASTSGGTPGADASGSRPTITRQWVSSGDMTGNTAVGNHQQRTREVATGTTERQLPQEVSGRPVGPPTCHPPSATTTTTTTTSTSSSSPASAATMAATASVTVRDQSTQSSADYSSINVDVVNSPGASATMSATDHPEPQLPPYESRAGTLDWDEIHEPSEALPDLLNSHRLPPNYVPAPRQNHHRSNRHGADHVSWQRARRSRNHQRPSPVTDLGGEDKNCCSKDCCLDCVTTVTTFRWVLIALAMLGVCCVISGIVLGALHMTVGSSFLTLSLMFIGLGVLLVVVVGVGWRCTPPGHEPCHLLFGLGEHASHDSRRSRMSRPHRDRNQWYGGALYPEFRYRRPPPSYNTAMQEHQQQLALAQIQMNNEDNANENNSLPGSPPPTYRSRASTVRPGIHITFPLSRSGDYPSSGPPTYRSQADPTEPTRPSLILDGGQNERSDSSGGVDNPGCVMTENSDPEPGPALPDGVENASSTMARVSRVVEYLDGILEQQSQGLGNSEAVSSQSSNPSLENSRASSGGANTPDEGEDHDNRIADTPM